LLPALFSSLFLEINHMPGLFHSTQQSPSGIEAEGEVRIFVGDGSPVLKVPNLEKVLSVHVGRTKVPLERDYKFPLNADAERKEKVRTTLPHIVLDENEAGEKVLMRSKHSNDGNWQDGVKIYVGGEWSDSELPPAAPGDEAFAGAVEVLANAGAAAAAQTEQGVRTPDANGKAADGAPKVNGASK
jgi:hypothetical protein